MHARTASCACGALTITVDRDSDWVYGCACPSCQKRSGSVFAYVAMFPAEAVVSYTGVFTTWRRTGETGFWTEHDFCTTCGSRLVIRMLDQPGRIGISVGNFTDPTFPAPAAMIWSSTLHNWLELPAGIKTVPSFER